MLALSTVAMLGVVRFRTTIQRYAHIKTHLTIMVAACAILLASSAGAETDNLF
jgi:hypothetical protein